MFAPNFLFEHDQGCANELTNQPEKDHVSHWLVSSRIVKPINYRWWLSMASTESMRTARQIENFIHQRVEYRFGKPVDDYESANNILGLRVSCWDLGDGIIFTENINGRACQQSSPGESNQPDGSFRSKSNAK